MMAGASFAVYSVIVGLEPERSLSYVIVALDLELSCLRSWYVESCLPRRFGEPELGFLLRGLNYIVCGGGDGRRYIGVGVNLDRVIVAQRSSRGIFALILVDRVLTIF